MNIKLQTLIDAIHASGLLTGPEKQRIDALASDVEKELALVAFKHERTEKIKHTMGVLLEANIAELEQKGKALEAQKRELEIEASLERVRTKAMGMKKSDDVLDICDILYAELQSLGFGELRNAMINIHDDKRKSFLNYDYSDVAGKTLTDIPYDSIPVIANSVNHMRKGHDAFAEFTITGKELDEWREFRRRNGEKDDPRLTAMSSLHYYFYSIGTGAIGISTFSPISKEKLELLKRFRNVFDLSYQRYTDISIAESQAKNARIEASLERVRSRTLAMQKSDELAETAAVLFRQLIALGIAPNRLYIAILKDEKGEAEFWITDEDGSKVSSGFAANLHANGSFKKMFEGWREGKRSLTIDMQGRELQEYFEHLISLNVPFQGGRTQLRRVQTIAFFSKGFIGMASPDEQPQETALLLERFASVFNLTFTRFHDLQLAEAQAHQAALDLIQLQAEKKRAEEALTELRVTQQQLVQQEKLASLGQLTAGIAHEIKNPLNFVNNFSSVSVELVDEAIEEMKKAAPELRNGDVAQILADVRVNLAKILEHGTRADGIVKSMLHHSRGGSGKMEPTDLNALLKEYVNLAFHGMRAAKNPINVGIELDLADSIGLVPLAAEEFSRVIVNVCQNAFDAMREKVNGAGQAVRADSYSPKLTVRSHRTAERIMIEIEDNGPGIPDAIKDKVLQPFFTTKRGTQGTGLGLSITHDIVKAHRGDLSIETNGNIGTTFVIGLPDA
jgi:signal transduction histidine kinase